jgi:diamine N-acetyltransferase
MIIIRKATDNDLPTIQRLAHEIWPGTYGEILSAEQLTYMLDLIYSIPALQQQVQEQQQQFVLVEMDNKAVAFAGYSIVAPGVCKLHKIYVHASTQGSGIGKKLVDHVINDVQPQGVNTIRLNVNRQNKARNFYEKLGFAIVREEDIDIGKGYYMVDYVMEKTI